MYPPLPPIPSDSAPSSIKPWQTVAGLWRDRELVWQFTLRNVEVRHRGSHLGLVWSVLSPLLTFGLYMFIFGYIFGGRYGVMANETRIDYALGLFLSLAIVGLVVEIIATSPLLIVTQPNFVKKVVFPLDVLPVASVGAAVFHFLISIALATLGVALAGPGLSWSALWVPVIILPVVLIALGLAWFASALGVFLRDIGQAAQFFSQVLIYASAVFYSHRIVPHGAWIFLRLNPMVHAVELARNALLWHRPLNLIYLAYLYAFGFTAFVLGSAFFRKMKPAFADVL
jgi:lipopolysaccharide transport system permease protein